MVKATASHSTFGNFRNHKSAVWEQSAAMESLRYDGTRLRPQDLLSEKKDFKLNLKFNLANEEKLIWKKYDLSGGTGG